MQRRGSQLPQQQAAQRRPSLQLPTLDDIGALLDGLPEKGSSTAMAAAAEEVAHHSGSLGRGADPAAELLASHAHARQHSGSLGTASPSKGPPSSAGTIVRSTEARPEPSTAVRGQPPGHRHAGWHSSAVLEQAAGHGHSQRVSLQEASNLGRNQALRAFIADGRPGHFAGAGECCALLAPAALLFLQAGRQSPMRLGLHPDQLPHLSKGLAAAAAGQGTTHQRLGPLSRFLSCLQRPGRQHG